MVRIWRATGVLKPWHVSREASGTWETPFFVLLGYGEGRDVELESKATEGDGESDQLIVL